MNEIDTQNNEMYMANTKILHLGPNANYISLTRVGVWPLKQNCCVGGSKPTRGPNANNFASQWSIGLRDVLMKCMYIQMPYMPLNP